MISPPPLQVEVKLSRQTLAQPTVRYRRDANKEIIMFHYSSADFLNFTKILWLA